MKPTHAAPAPRPTDALWQRYRENKDLAAREQLLDSYLGLVIHSARELCRRGPQSIEMDELISAGTIGLVQALEGFEPERGLAFSTFAVPRIRGAMLDELRSQDWMPRTVRARTRKLAQTRAELQHRLGTEPSASQMAAALDVDLDTYWKWSNESDPRRMLGLDQEVGADSADRARLCETIPDTVGEQPGEALVHEQTMTQLRVAFDRMSEKDRLVLTLYYFEGLSLRQIGEVLHVTESRVSQIHSRAIQRLRAESALSEELP